MNSSDLLTVRLELLRLHIGKVSIEDRPCVLNQDRLVAIDHSDLQTLGITLIGSGTTQIFLTEPKKSVGAIRIEARGSNAVIVIDSDHRGGRISANIRIFDHDCNCILSTPDYGIANLPIVSLRSPCQSFYWGRGATAVGLSVEIEGEGRVVMIGDDALISSGVWIRNHDMHSVIDLDDDTVSNPNPVDTFIEPHVWIGQDALLLNCEQVGYGCILAAKSLIRGRIPPTSILAGVPGRIVRQQTSWGRSPAGLSARERDLLTALRKS